MLAGAAFVVFIYMFLAFSPDTEPGQAVSRPGLFNHGSLVRYKGTNANFAPRLQEVRRRAAATPIKYHRWLGPFTHT